MFLGSMQRTVREAGRIPVTAGIRVVAIPLAPTIVARANAQGPTLAHTAGKTATATAMGHRWDSQQLERQETALLAAAGARDPGLVRPVRLSANAVATDSRWQSSLHAPLAAAVQETVAATVLTREACVMFAKSSCWVCEGPRLLGHADKLGDACLLPRRSAKPPQKSGPNISAIRATLVFQTKTFCTVRDYDTRLLWEARYPSGVTMIAGASCTLAVHSFTTTTTTATMTPPVARGCTGRLDVRTICWSTATMLLARAQLVASTKFCACKTLC